MKAVILLVLLSLVVSGEALAQDESPFETKTALELSLSGLAIASSSLLPMVIFSDGLDAPACGSCDPGSVNRLDRPVVGYHNGVAKSLSDVSVGVLVVSPFVFTALDTLVVGKGGGLDAFATESAVLTETFAAQLTLVQVVKHIVRRPRPLTYSGATSEEEKKRFDNSLSFYSGHSSTAFSMAVAYNIIYQERHPDDPMRFVVWGAELSLATLTATMRVGAGKHFWSDVVTGALVGTAFGVLIPTLHLKGGGQGGGSSASMPLVFMGSF